MDKSTIAIIISGLSLALSFWNVMRDRSRLKIESKFYEGHPDYGPDRIHFKAMNKGRRPIYIRTIGGELMDNGWIGEHIGDGEFGHKLEEGQYLERIWEVKDVYADGPDFEDEYKSIWLEDSLGKRYKVPKSEKYLVKLKSSNRVRAGL
ncbi:MAG: hypothetical protein KME36_13955 [Candidatus Thiodiazotropha sp. (ex Lucina pensylvanica)]|nr:hypothetical protein [Candidatus Thiodiazotropha sp. (ex Lucina pensylvanica)]MBT3051526.1 hypothetical protein [Candidatus Thiodiazotropha sp. (ex Codakia orbicularis)]